MHFIKHFWRIENVKVSIAMVTLTGRMCLKIHLVRNSMISGPFYGLYEGLEKKLWLFIRIFHDRQICQMWQK